MIAHAPAVGRPVLEGRRYSSRSGALVDQHVDGEAVGLEVVGHVVLGVAADAVVLHAVDVGGRELAGEHRVLAHALEVPAAVAGSGAG